MMVLTKGIWVVVADEERALILENTADAKKPVLGLVSELNTADLLAVADRSTRWKDHKQHEITEPANFARMGGARLAEEICSHLAQKSMEGAFDRVILVAAPQVLGALRAKMDVGQHARVMAEIPKTMTGLPLPRIAELLARELAAE